MTCRIAFVHDWLLGMRGGEKVLEGICELFPEAPIYTLLARPERLSEGLRAKDIRPSHLQSLPFVDRYYRYLLPLMPKAVGRLDLSQFDVVVSSSHCVAKGVYLGEDGKRPLHVCYCHSPMRYIYDQFDSYFSGERSSFGWVTRAAARAVRSYLAKWDKASSDRVDFFVANSENVRKRIERHYGRRATVIYPPVDVSYFTPGPSDFAGKPYYLAAGALVPYKRVDIAIEACRRLGVALKIVGVGSEEKKLRKLAEGADVEFLGWQSRSRLRSLYRGCQALLFPQDEDFGIAAVEAQACGRPVIAYGSGGALETVEDGVTGILFSEQTAASMAQAIGRSQAIRWDPTILIERAQRFHADVFKRKMARFLEDCVRRASESDGQVRRLVLADHAGQREALEDGSAGLAAEPLPQAGIDSQLS